MPRLDDDSDTLANRGDRPLNDALEAFHTTGLGRDGAAPTSRGEGT